MEQTPTDKVVSEIVRKKQPYKEIEAIINDNCVIIRMQKEPVKEEYDIPCECIGQVTSKESLSQKKCEDGIEFGMPQGNLELCRVPREDAPSMKKTCEEAGCRTVTLYPKIKNDIGEVKKLKVVRPIDLEENPNIFLLRVRKHCNDKSGDKKQTIDLEFRTPRPWLSMKKEEHLKPEVLEEHEEEHADKKCEDDIDKKSEDEIMKKYKGD